MITPAEYEKVREGLGSQRDVAKMLGVDVRTVQRRETGQILITSEATRALFCLSALYQAKHLFTIVTNNGIKPSALSNELTDLVGLLEMH